jgi:hypothetical protein
MSIDIIKCNNCKWAGNALDLESSNFHFEDPRVCPKCKEFDSCEDKEPKQ